MPLPLMGNICIPTRSDQPVFGARAAARTAYAAIKRQLNRPVVARQIERLRVNPGVQFGGVVGHREFERRVELAVAAPATGAHAGGDHSTLPKTGRKIILMRWNRPRTKRSGRTNRNRRISMLPLVGISVRLLIPGSFCYSYYSWIRTHTASQRHRLVVNNVGRSVAQLRSRRDAIRCSVMPVAQ
jgi:hypothetical protein